MRQQAQVYLFLSPTMEALLGENGKEALAKLIKDTAERRIKGYIPYAIEVVPLFSVHPMAGSAIIGYVSFLLFPNVSIELIKAPIVSAAQSAIAQAVSGPGEGVTVVIHIGGIFTMYPS